MNSYRRDLQRLKMALGNSVTGDPGDPGDPERPTLAAYKHMRYVETYGDTDAQIKEVEDKLRALGLSEAEIRAVGRPDAPLTIEEIEEIRCEVTVLEARNAQWERDWKA